MGTLDQATSYSGEALDLPTWTPITPRPAATKARQAWTSPECNIGGGTAAGPETPQGALTLLPRGSPNVPSSI